MFSLFEDMDTPQNITNESNNDSLWSVSLGTKVVISQSLNVIQI